MQPDAKRAHRTVRAGINQNEQTACIAKDVLPKTDNAVSQHITYWVTKARRG